MISRSSVRYNPKFVAGDWNVSKKRYSSQLRCLRGAICAVTLRSRCRMRQGTFFNCLLHMRVIFASGVWEVVRHFTLKVVPTQKVLRIWPDLRKRIGRRWFVITVSQGLINLLMCSCHQFVSVSGAVGYFSSAIFVDCNCSVIFHIYAAVKLFCVTWRFAIVNETWIPVTGEQKLRISYPLFVDFAETAHCSSVCSSHNAFTN